MSSKPLFPRLLSSIKRRIARLTWTGGFRVVSAEGVLFLLDYRNYVDRLIYVHGGYEQDRIDYLLEHMKKMNCDVFMDVGANFGLYSILVADRLAVPQIHAFEPDPRNFDQLHANLYLNSLSLAITPRQCAVSDRNGDLRLFLADSWSTGTTRITDSEDGLLIEAVCLDDCHDFSDKTIAIKIDVEGHEQQALNGMTGILANNRCLVQVECFVEKHTGLGAIFGECGYRLIHQIGDDYYYTNIDDQ